MINMIGTRGETNIYLLVFRITKISWKNIEGYPYFLPEIYLHFFLSHLSGDSYLFFLYEHRKPPNLSESREAQRSFQC